MTAVRSTDDLLAYITSGLAAEPEVALARVWLLAPGDICDTCPRRADCPGHVTCLHLASSAGTSRDPNADWSRIDGSFRRFPVGSRKIGRVVNEGPIRLEDITEDAAWIARPEWAEPEGIRGFGAVPLAFGGKTIGVLGVFCRAPFSEEMQEWLQLIGDHLAAAIINARAFEEIDCLRRKLELENEYLREEVAAAVSFSEIIGESVALKKVLEAIETVATTGVNVLVTGESGTGKELVARALHRLSERSGTLVKVNCASVPRELFESEFFGHAKGSFTGAIKDRAGRFGLADGGTLFLDEVGEIPLDMQSKLLRVLQEGEYERVGEEKTNCVDVRVVAATNRDLQKEVAEGRFREDLYYRLNVFPIEVAPLRERAEDIPLLAAHFIRSAAPKLKRPARELTDENKSVLMHYHWPGNIRELQNVVERAMILSRSGDLRFELPQTTSSDAPAMTARQAAGVEDEVISDSEMKRRESENIVRALTRCNWRVYGSDGAAELLGVNPSTLSSRMKKLGIAKPAG
jgi:transcriptional regulator with GAF, ATPase, and Fis domain